MIYYCNCVGVCNLNGVDYEITDHSVFLVTPTDFHKIKTEYRDGSYSINVSFTPDAIERSILSAVNYTPRAVLRPNALLIQNIRALWDDFEEASKFSEERLHARLGITLLDILKADDRGAEKSKLSPYVCAAMEEISKNPSDDITLCSVAKKLSFTPNYFSKLFHDSLGVTFKEYLNTVRTQYAKRLLQETELSVTQIGTECGYQTPSQFFRVFKKMTGVTPAVYRKNLL